MNNQKKILSKWNQLQKDASVLYKKRRFNNMKWRDVVEFLKLIDMSWSKL